MSAINIDGGRTPTRVFIRGLLRRSAGTVTLDLHSFSLMSFAHCVMTSSDGADIDSRVGMGVYTNAFINSSAIRTASDARESESIPVIKTGLLRAKPANHSRNDTPEGGGGSGDTRPTKRSPSIMLRNSSVDRCFTESPSLFRAMIHSTAVEGCFALSPQLLSSWRIFTPEHAMTTSAIHVHTQADKSTVGFARFMWETMLAMASRPDLVKLTVHCMGPKAVELLRDLRQTTCVQAFDSSQNPLNGSHGHGVCIMAALRMMIDTDIHVIADSDTVIVAKGWDDYLRKRMCSDGVGMMGTTYEDLDGFSSGSGRVQTYKKVPTFTWVALNPKHSWPRLDVIPNKGHEIRIATEEMSQIYNLPVGYKVFGEAGYQVPQFVFDNRIKYDGWRQLKPTKEAIVLKGLSDYHEEYHADGMPYVVHHRGSMKHSYRGDRTSNAFYGAVDKYLITELARKEPRWTWSDDGSFIEAPKDVPTVHKPIAQEAGPARPIPAGAEWIKISHCGTVIRPRRAVNRTSEPAITCDFGTEPSLGHLRIEGHLNQTLDLVIPGSTRPYSITCRNATQEPLIVSLSGDKPNVEVSGGKTLQLLIDIDGIFKIE